MRRFVYMHGFASGPKSYKGVELAKMYRRNHNITLHCADLNYPNFSNLTISGALKAMDKLDKENPGLPWNIIGSSMGGYVGSRWAQLNPKKVEKLLLLCPGFKLVDIRTKIMGEKAIEKWKQNGTMDFLNYETNQNEPLSYNYLADIIANHPPVPLFHYEHQTIVVHGVKDETVPIQSSRDLVAQYPFIKLIEVSDDHLLTKSLPQIYEISREFFSLKDVPHASL